MIRHETRRVAESHTAGLHAGLARPIEGPIIITVFHLSDFHVRRKYDTRCNQNVSRLVDHLLTRYGHLSRKSTYAVITGDMVNSITRTHYKNLKALALDPLRERFQVLAVPGNHDYGKVGHFFDIRGPNRFCEFVDNRVHPTVDPPPENVPAGESPVRFIGMDTADRDDRVFSANGIVDEAQLERLADILARFEREFVVVYCHHHPFNRNPFTAFRRYRQFLKTVAGKVNVVLFGHKHTNAALFNRAEVPLMLAAGRSTKSNAGALSYRVLSLDTKAPDFGKGLNGVRFFIEEIPAALPDEAGA